MSPLVATLSSAPPSLLAPDEVAGLTAWYRADSGLYQEAEAPFTPVSLSGQVVGRWEDLSGNGRHLTQPGALALKPTWKPDRVNGQPAVLFDGSDDFLVTTAALSTLIAAGNCCVYLVGAVLSVTAPASGATYTRPAFLADTGGFFGLFADATPQVRAYTWFAGEFTVSVPIPTPVSTPAYFGFRLRHVMPGAAPSTLFFRRTGVFEASVGANVTENRSSPVRLGRNYAAVALHCGIAELFFYNVAVGAADLAGLDAYITDRYPSLIW